MSWQAELLAALWRSLHAQHRGARTTRCYLGWVQRYILYCRNRHPRQLSAHDVDAFVAHLDMDLHVTARGRAQAMAALRHLYGVVLQTPAVEHGRTALAAVRPLNLR